MIKEFSDAPVNGPTNGTDREAALRSVLIDAHGTVLWLEHRLPKGYGDMPHVKRTIAALEAEINDQCGSPSAAPESGQAASIANDAEFRRLLMNWYFSKQISDTKEFHELAAYIDSRPRSEDSRAAATIAQARIDDYENKRALVNLRVAAQNELIESQRECQKLRERLAALASTTPQKEG